jgi:uncharacterized integral membrane protein
MKPLIALILLILTIGLMIYRPSAEVRWTFGTVAAVAGGIGCLIGCIVGSFLAAIADIGARADGCTNCPSLTGDDTDV